MSLCLIMSQGDKTYIGADTACSMKKLNGDGYYRYSSDLQKLFCFNNYVVFFSGIKSTVDSCVSHFNTEEFTIQNLQRYLIDNVQHTDDSMFDIESLVVDYDTFNIYQISQYNNFEIVTYEKDDRFRIICGGYKTDECFEIAKQYVMLNSMSVTDVYQKCFNELADECIGGNLIIYSGVNDKNVFSIDNNESKFLLTAKFVTAGYVSGSQMISGDIYSENFVPKQYDDDGNLTAYAKGTHIDLNDGNFIFADDKIEFYQDVDDDGGLVGHLVLRGVEVSKEGKTGTLSLYNTLNESIKTIENWYLATDQDSGVTYPETPGWTTESQSVTKEKPYLWQYEIITYQSEETSTKGPYISSSYGVGEEGRGVTGVTEYYYTNNSQDSSTLPAWDDYTSWKTTITQPTKDAQYVWNYELVQYSKGTSSTHTAPSILAHYTADGRGITKVEEYYAVSASNTTYPTLPDFSKGTMGDWKTTPLETNQSTPYLWNFERIMYDDNTYEIHDPAMIGSYAKSNYTVDLTNENHTFIGGQNDKAVKDQSTTCGVIGFMGATQKKTWVDVSSITTPTGMTVTVDNNGATNTVLTISVTTDFATLEGTLDIEISVGDDKNNPEYQGTKTFSYTLVLPGKNANSNYSVELSNENHTYVGKADKTIYTGQYATIDVMGFYGTDEKSISIGEISSPKWFTVTKPTDKQVKIELTSTPTDTNGTIEIPVTVDNKQLITKAFSWTMIYDAVGEPAVSYDMIIDSTSVKKAVSGTTYTYTPATINVSAVKYTGGTQSSFTGYVEYTYNSKTASGSSFTIPNEDIPNVTITLYEDSNKKAVLDKETITMVVDGINGDTGNGITSVDEYYAINNDKDTAPTSWTKKTESTKIPNPTKDNPYLWNYETTNYSKTAPVSTSPVVIAIYTEDGAPGEPGRGIESITEYYAKGNSSSTYPTLPDFDKGTLGDWTTNPATITLNEDYPYLWNFARILYDDNTAQQETPAVISYFAASNYTVDLSNESYTFIGTAENKFIAGSTTTKAYGYLGTTAQSITLGDITAPTGFTITKSGPNSDKSYTITIAVAAGTACSDGNITIPIIIDGNTISKVFSYSYACPGSDGSPAEAYELVLDTNTIKATKNESGNYSYSPNSITPKVMKYTGADTPSEYTGGTIRYTIGTTVSTTTPGSKIAINSTSSMINNVLIEYIKDSKVLDSETIGVIIDGVDGNDAIAYDLIMDAACINKSISGTYSPATINANAQSTTGANNPVAYSGRFTIDITSDGTAWSNAYTSKADESKCSYTLSGSIKAVRTTLYASGGTTAQLDQETVYVVTDGQTGGQGNSVTNTVTYYYLHTSDTDAPTFNKSTWSTTPTWESGKYIWSSLLNTFSDGTEKNTDPILEEALNKANEDLVKFKGNVKDCLGANEVDIGTDTVIAPKIGGGYLYLVNGDKEITLDPSGVSSREAGKSNFIYVGSSSDAENGYIFKITDAGKAYFNGSIHATSGKIADFVINSDSLTSTKTTTDTEYNSGEESKVTLDTDGINTQSIVDTTYDVETTGLSETVETFRNRVGTDGTAVFGGFTTSYNSVSTYDYGNTTINNRCSISPDEIKLFSSYDDPLNPTEPIQISGHASHITQQLDSDNGNYHMQITDNNYVNVESPNLSVSGTISSNGNRLGQTGWAAFNDITIAKAGTSPTGAYLTINSDGCGKGLSNIFTVNDDKPGLYCINPGFYFVSVRVGALSTSSPYFSIILYQKPGNSSTYTSYQILGHQKVGGCYTYTTVIYLSPNTTTSDTSNAMAIRIENNSSEPVSLTECGARIAFMGS